MSDNQEKPFLGIPTPLWNTIIASIVTIILSYMSIRTQNKIDDAGSETKKAVVEVKTAVEEKGDASEEKLNTIAKVGRQTHVLVNGTMGAQLKVNAELARAKADLSNDPVDEAAAVLAEQALKDHRAKEAAADKSDEEN